MKRAIASFALTLMIVALIGCGSTDEDTATVGIDTDGSSITMPKAEALDYLFETEEGIAQLGRSICRSVGNEGLREARASFVKSFDAELEAEFSADELFDEAASRC